MSKKKKKIGGHGVCLGDIVQNIAKMSVFCSFYEGIMGEFYESWLKIEQISNFPINLTNSQFSCLIFVKEQ